ncbi:tyrosine-type recombinase/integrase [Changpingibacter yushuensis]|uniref:tyrosine-type recombinase/integrase n=1 Tax=Changpingibacter yushuensis TaxID=2758440 RepID=UPI00165E1276|nr:tyrosine-type recombinase/integrase [Changpingibacter yushuensis]
MPKKRSHGDGALYSIRNGQLWRGVIDLGTDPATGKRLQKTVTSRTKTGALAKMQKVRDEIRDFGAPLDKTVTVGRWAEEWLEKIAKPNVDPSTFAGYRSAVNVWVKPTIGRKRVAQLKPSDVRAVLDTMRDKGRSTSLMRSCHIVMCEMLDGAKDERICARNVARDVTRPGGRTDKRIVASTRTSFTTEQGVAILEAAARLPVGQATRFWFKMLAGQRQGEILGASLADLDLDAGTYQVNWKLEELERDHGCNPKNPCGKKYGAYCSNPVWRVPDDFEKKQVSGRWHLTRPKSKTGKIVPLIPPLVEALRLHVQAQADQPNPNGLIWHNLDGTPIDPAVDQQEWRELLVAANIITPEQAVPRGTTLTGHVARHTTVTVLASFGVDFQLIGEIVGQSSLQVTEMYRHASSEEKMNAMKKLGSAFADGLKVLPAATPQEAAEESV